MRLKFSNWKVCACQKSALWWCWKHLKLSNWVQLGRPKHGFLGETSTLCPSCNGPDLPIPHHWHGHLQRTLPSRSKTSKLRPWKMIFSWRNGVSQQEHGPWLVDVVFSWNFNSIHVDQSWDVGMAEGSRGLQDKTISQCLSAQFGGEFGPHPHSPSQLWTCFSFSGGSIANSMKFNVRP